MQKKEIFFEAFRFAIVGVGATAIHYIIYFLLSNYINLKVAYTIGYVISFVFNYLFSSRFTFKKKASKKNGIGFISAHLINYILQIVLLSFFLWLGISRTLAPLPVYLIAIPTNFILVRLVFKKL